MGECAKDRGAACGIRRRSVGAAAAYSAATCGLGLALAARCATAGLLPAAVGALALAAWCAILGVVDLRNLRLPDLLTIPGAAAILAAAGAAGHGAAALWGAGLLTAAYLCMHLLRPAAMGAGDAKLAAGLGAATALGGGDAWLAAATGALLLTAMCGIAVSGRTRNAAWPHGPSMCIASLAALLAAG
ncbi:prepilin peptidase [Tomitella fengzijianii]|uniref:Prepilin peptidase n=1 Tax=Tomitella fengzijianii TaxID=2597660 RepID=A0A516X319_9ACTN|nr:prepilin peptidase [Tomitella fengzijianii]QDQ97472.1 prepilin peptidase [Tomitella fengzijianii]